MDEVATEGFGSKSFEDVEFSEEDQSNISKLFFISPLIDFVQVSVYWMCGSRMRTFKIITYDRLTHIETSFSFPIYLKWGYFPPVNSVFK